MEQAVGVLTEVMDKNAGGMIEGQQGGLRAMDIQMLVEQDSIQALEDLMVFYTPEAEEAEEAEVQLVHLHLIKRIRIRAQV